MLGKFQTPTQIIAWQLDVVLGLTFAVLVAFGMLFSFTFPYINGGVDIARVVLPTILYAGLVGCMVHAGDELGHQGVLTDVMQTNPRMERLKHIGVLPRKLL